LFVRAKVNANIIRQQCHPRGMTSLAVSASIVAKSHAPAATRLQPVHGNSGLKAYPRVVISVYTYDAATIGGGGSSAGMGIGCGGSSMGVG
jgi:hypothetical protein